tara:strand:- start:11 stop:637 length:627 start_codon:yes stop_codon:yes gene_type:complete
MENIKAKYIIGSKWTKKEYDLTKKEEPKNKDLLYVIKCFKTLYNEYNKLIVSTKGIKLDRKEIILDKKEYTTQEVANLFGISNRAIQRRCKNSNLKMVFGTYKIPKGIIEDWKNGISTLKKYKKKNVCLTKKTYIIKNQENGLYKIGRSNNPRHREKTLQAETPNVIMIKIWNKDIESKLHKEYSKYRRRGEWFKLTKIQVHYICTHY